MQYSIPGFELGKIQANHPSEMGIWNWFSDLIKLENNEKSNVCACGKWYTGN